VRLFTLCASARRQISALGRRQFEFYLDSSVAKLLDLRMGRECMRYALPRNDHGGRVAANFSFNDVFGIWASSFTTQIRARASAEQSRVTDEQKSESLGCSLSFWASVNGNSVIDAVDWRLNVLGHRGLLVQGDIGQWF